MAHHDEHDHEPATDRAHGVHATQRDDSKMQEEPSGSGQVDSEEWAERTETGGQAS